MVHIHFQHFIKAVVLAAFALFFLKLHATGDISKFINPKYELMSLVAIWIFIVLFIIQLFRVWESNHVEHTHCPPGCSHDHGESASFPRKLVNWAIIIFPLVTGFALSPAVLDSSIAANKGTILPQSNSSYIESESDSHDHHEGQEAKPNDHIFSEAEYEDRMKKLEEADAIEMEDDIFAVYYEAISNNPKSFQGKKIRVKGFVYKEKGMKQNQLVVSRFMITHCVADSNIIGLLTDFEQANNYHEDTWLEIEGILEVTTYNGVEIPMIKATEWKAINEPTQPYVYPVLTEINLK